MYIVCTVHQVYQIQQGIKYKQCTLFVNLVHTQYTESDSDKQTIHNVQYLCTPLLHCFHILQFCFFFNINPIHHLSFTNLPYYHELNIDRYVNNVVHFFLIWQNLHVVQSTSPLSTMLTILNFFQESFIFKITGKLKRFYMQNNSLMKTLSNYDSYLAQMVVYIHGVHCL